MRRLFAITWLASTVCAAAWIIVFGFAGEEVLWLSLNTWLALVFGFALAAGATAVPAGLLAAALWAIGIKRAMTKAESGTPK
jgi:hypothetical protein